MRVVIVGYGVVGRATHSILNAETCRVDIFDPDQGYSCNQEGVDVAIVCTPCLDGDIDCIASLEAFSPSLKHIVVRSTVIPSALKELTKEFPGVEIHFWPEFLSEDTAMRDVKSPDKFIWGNDSIASLAENTPPFTTSTWSSSTSSQAMAISSSGQPTTWVPLPDAQSAPWATCLPGLLVSLDRQPKVRYVSLEAASLIKLAINTYYSMSVAFYNSVFEATKQDKAMYNYVLDGMHADSRIKVTHSEIFDKGYRGAGGKCLPKDTANFAKHLTSTAEFDEATVFIESIGSLNAILRESSNLPNGE